MLRRGVKAESEEEVRPRDEMQLRTEELGESVPKLSDGTPRVCSANSFTS